MQAVSHQSSTDRRRIPLSQRAVALLLAIGLQLLLVLALLNLGHRMAAAPETDHPLSTFSLLPDRTPARTATAKPKAVARAKSSASDAAPPATLPPRPRPPVEHTPPPPANPLFGNRALFDGADIAALPSHDEDAGSAQGGRGQDSVAAYGPGEGPGGVRLYNAEWYREPSHAELAGYLPNGAPLGSWAEIACHTIPDYHVDNCRFLGESPMGSGLGRAMREAAWQFRVRPPRAGGKTLVGAWVRIHFDFSRDAKSD